MGPGVSNYLKFLKALSWLFCIWTAFSIPIIVLISFGTGSGGISDSSFLSRFTLGRIGDDWNVTTLDVLLTDCSPSGAAAKPCTVSKIEAAQVITLCDIIAASIFAVAYVWIRVMEKREAKSVDRHHLTVQDYTLMVQRIPPHTRAMEIGEHFKELSGGTDDSIANVQIAEDDTELLTIFVKRGRVLKKLTDLTERASKVGSMFEKLTGQKITSMVETNAAKVLQERVDGKGVRVVLNKVKANRRKATGLLKQYMSLMRRRTRLVEEIKVMNDKAKNFEKDDRALAAFVTFNRAADALSIFKAYQQAAWLWCKCCYPRQLFMPVRAVGKALPGETKPVAIKVKAAPPPSTILWENLSFSWSARMGRRLLTFIASVALLLFSVLVGTLASWQQSRAIQATTAKSCSTTASLEELSTLAKAANHTDADVQCFCSHLSSNPVALAVEPSCGEWVRAVASATVLTVLVALLVPVVNFWLKAILKTMTTWEAHHSVNSQAESFSQRLFILTVVNTAFLPLLINAKIPGVNSPGNNFTDFSPEWYYTVGVQIVITMGINVVAPHSGAFFRYIYKEVAHRGCCLGCCGGRCACGHCGDPSKRAASQRQLNSWFEGPDFHLSTRYATVMQTVFTTLVYASLLPLLIPLAMISMLLSVYVDKWLLLRFYRTPPHYDVHLGRAMTSWIPWGIFVHFAFAAFALSNPKIFTSETTKDQLLAQFGSFAAVAGSDAIGIAARLQQTHVIALTVAALVVLALIILTKFLHGFTRSLTFIGSTLTCGMCQSQDEFESELMEARKQLTFTDALTKNQLMGLPSYNMLQNPDRAKAMAISPEFAKRLNRLIEYRQAILPDVKVLEGATPVPTFLTALAAKKFKRLSVRPLQRTGDSKRHPRSEVSLVIGRPAPPPPTAVPPVAVPAAPTEDRYSYMSSAVLAAMAAYEASSHSYAYGHEGLAESDEEEGDWEYDEEAEGVGGRGAAYESTYEVAHAEVEEYSHEGLGHDVSSRVLAAWRQGLDWDEESEAVLMRRASAMGDATLSPSGGALGMLAESDEESEEYDPTQHVAMDLYREDLAGTGHEDDDVLQDVSVSDVSRMVRPSAEAVWGESDNYQ
jgi:hypothetical protein